MLQNDRPRHYLVSKRLTLSKDQFRNFSHSNVERAITPVPMIHNVHTRVVADRASAASAADAAVLVALISEASIQATGIARLCIVQDLHRRRAS